MTLLSTLVAMVIFALCVLFFFRRPFPGAPLFIGLLPIFARLALATFHLEGCEWVGETTQNAPFLAAGWMPLFVGSSALIFMSLYGTIGRITGNRSTLLAVAALTLPAIWFSYGGAVNHPVGSVLDLSVLAWLLVIIGMGEGIAAEHATCSDETRRTMYAECALTVSLGAIIGLMEQVTKTSTFSTTLSVLSIAVAVACIALMGMITPARRRIPLLTIIVLLWCICYGMWLEFV